MHFDPDSYRPFNSLPNEIFEHLLSFLSLTSLASTALVAQRWHLFSKENAGKQVRRLWESKIKKIDSIPNKKYRPLELIYKHLDVFTGEEKHALLGKKIKQFVIDHGQPPSPQFESYINLNNCYWKSFLRGHLERLNLEQDSNLTLKTLTFKVNQNWNKQNWNNVDAITKEFPTQTDKLVVQLTSNSLPKHSSASKLPLQLLKQSDCLEEMGVTVSKRLALSLENLKQISQFILDNHNNSKSKNIHTLNLTFNHIYKNDVFSFIRLFKPLNKRLNIVFQQVFGHAESCEAIHLYVLKLDKLRKEVNPKITLSYKVKISL